MDTERYRQRLLALERDLEARGTRAVASAREPVDDTPGDRGDDSVRDERREELLAAAGSDRAVLNQVKDALVRIDAGTFGQCVVDGAPIEERRLEAVPWTPFCLKHQEQSEPALSKPPTL